jgi:hypothetical protein
MPIRDRNIGWKCKRFFRPAHIMQGLDNNGTASITLSEGTPTIEPITTSEIVGLPMDTADEIADIFPIPWDMNRDKKMLARIYFQHAAAGADTPQFTFTSAFFAKQAAMTEFIANADKSTAFAAHTCSTTNPSLEVTVWTDLSWEDYLTDTDVLAAVSVELNALGSASTDECKLLGVEYMYQVEATDSLRRKIENEIARNPV